MLLSCYSETNIFIFFRKKEKAAMGDLMNAIGSMLHSQPQSVHSLRALTLETDLIDDDPFYMEKRVAKLARNRNKHHGLEPPERGKPSKDLDIRRITNRVLTMGLPTTEPSNKQQHQININAASQFLNARYSSNYMVINLACNSYLNLADSIQGEYDDKIFGNRVINFPVSKAYKSNLKSLIDISKAITGYLTLDIRNVVVVHCFNGLAKTSTAVCSYLIFANIVENASDALDYFNLRRGLAPGTCASLGQRRYLEYFDALYSFNGKLNNPYAIYLSEICLNNVNGLIGDTGGKSVIGIEIYESSRLVLSTIPKRTTALESVPVRITSDSNSLTFKPINPLRVKRDIQIRFFRHIKSEKINQIITIASFTFHSGFIPTGLIRVSQSDLEISKKGGVSERSDFTIDIQIDPPPILNNEQSRIISYTAALDPSLSKCLKTLSTYHCVKPSDAVFLKLIQKQYDKSLGIIFFNLVFLSLSMTDNDLNAAKRYLEKLLNDFPILKLDTYDSDKPLKRDTIVENEPRNGNGRVESYYIQELGDPYKDDVVSKIQGDSRRMRDVLDRTSRNNNGPSALDRLQGRNGGDRPHNNGDSRARKDQQSFNDEDRQLDHMINDLDIRRSRRPEEYSRQNREHRRSRSSEKIREENNLKSNRAGPPMAGPPPPMAGPPPPPFNPMIAAPMPPAGGGPPPPPFNPMGGGPPPPPNPMGGGPPPPPPGPGGMAGFGAPEPFDPNKLSAKNKFHWKEIKNVQGSVWKDLQISAVNQPIVRLDIKKFEGFHY
jgi:phosphatidylinositol-3,4,5-trisphosphate 3-phosphatase/dual-specificity protein phosphatase PTEN